MSSKFDKIRPWATELAALERLEKSPYNYNGRNLVNTLAPSFFIWIFFILAGNEDMHESLDEIKFQQDHAANNGVSCPWASEKSMYNVVNILAPSFLIESSSFLQVTRTAIKPGLSSKLSLMMGLCTAELAAIERLNISP